ncbi:hypothetical protein [Oleiagrimonas soli]|uniref:Uncharacterized protein n=1 Tax=Oleiagrimonas soli TaxID=1543381 RepID=A0A099CT42_9GAMM|nr:hypothetical protein [Oleiagrimonas soli]KGI76939.1 hypothetical protein LF63_0113585 [Oleiagrimonas soli]MBB6185189.1 hypothetical protein [Oleiagrimonas soli]
MNHRSLFLLRIVVWLVLLLTAWGVLQYAMHAWRLMHLMGQAPAEQASRMRWMLAWDAVYVLAAGLTLSAAAGVLLWRARARPVLRWLAFVLAAYSLASGVHLFAQWQSFQHASVDLLAQSPYPDLARALIDKVNRTTLISLGLKAISVPVLAWLGWRLGATDVVQRFASAKRA